jgi:hypothetical protein
MKMEITVRLKNADGETATELTTIEVDVPGFEEFTGPDIFGAVFDEYERGFIKARNEAGKDATEKYLNELVKKKGEVSGIKGKRIEKPKSYIIDAEIGQLAIDIIEIKQGSREVFNVGKEVFPETGPREHYKTCCFRELAVFFPCDETFRKSAKKINRVLWREKGAEVQFRTIANQVEQEGSMIQECLSKKTEQILIDNGFNTGGLPKNGKRTFEPLATDSVISQETVKLAIEEWNEGKEKEQQIELKDVQGAFEHPASVKANISLDDVCCKKQKASGRQSGAPAKEKREFVNNTVAHIQSSTKQVYTLNAANLTKMMLMVLAFLLSNGLMSVKGQLVFFIDGAQELPVAIRNIFGGSTCKIILDWYHLEKKCQQRLSQAMKGKDVRNKALEGVLPFLWIGNIEAAKKYLRSLKEDGIKSKDQIEKLIDYFSRNCDFIPCYALRKKLGLRVSSNQVEKANDLVVSSRQKHNGMSWSANGSTSLATLTSTCLNNEDMNWLLKRDILFKFDAGTQKSAA